MKNIGKSLDILSYFFKLNINSSSESRFYSEKFIIRTKKTRGIIILLFKFLSIKNESYVVLVFSVIFLKNLFKSKLDKYFKIKNDLIVNCLIDISAFYPIKLISPLNEIILQKIEINSQNVSNFNIFFEKINHKLSNKILSKFNNESFYSILSILEKITIVCSNITNITFIFENYLKTLEKTLNYILSLVGKISDLHPTKLHLKVINLFINFFKEVNKFNLITPVGRDLDNWVLIFLFILHKSKHNHILVKAQLKLSENIISVLSGLSFSYQNEFSIYLPILCNLGLKMSKFIKTKKLSSSIELISTVNTSANNLIILKNSYFKDKLNFFLLQIISNHISVKESFFFLPIFVFSKEKFNFTKRLSYANILVNNICIKKRKLIFNFPKFYFEYDVTYSFLLFISPIVFYSIYSIINGTYIKGIYVTFFLPNTKILFNNFIKNHNIFNEKKKNISFIDFVSFFRYQLSVKLLFKASNLIFRKIIEDENLDSHSLSGLERILTLRGNYETGILLFCNSNKCQEDLLLFLLKKLKIDKATYMIKLNIKKLFMKIILNNFKYNEIYRNITFKYILSILENFFKNKADNFLAIYDFEIINLKIFSHSNIDKILLTEILRFGIYSISDNQVDVFPYIFDTFASIISIGQYDISFTVFVRFFRSLLNPHLWFSKPLVRSLVGYLNAFILNEKYIYNKYEIVSLCCIIQTIIIEHCDTEYFFYFLISFFRIIEKQKNILPHFLEILISNQKFFLTKQSKNYFYIFVILSIDKIGLDKIIEISNKIRKNILINLFEIFSSKFIFLLKNAENRKLFFILIEIIFGKILTSNLIILKKIIGKIFRQIICFSKILEKQPKFTEINNFNNSVRFKINHPINSNYLVLTKKATFILDKINESILTFIAKSHGQTIL
nr:exportin-2 [Cryptomonas curvata]